jgi:hypothetical protein
VVGVADGLAVSAAGKFVEGLPAFGYKRAQASASSDKPRRLEIDPPQAAIVREMFDLCIRGGMVHLVA